MVSVRARVRVSVGARIRVAVLNDGYLNAYQIDTQ